MDIIAKYPDLLELYNRNDNETKDKIRHTITEKISKSDGVGYVYGFYSPKDHCLRTNFWIKLGRTERNPFVRVEKEWNGELVFCLKTNYNHRLERLIHLFLDYAREPRVDICEKVHKVKWWKKILCCFKKDKLISSECKREIEWFHFKEKINIVSLVSQIWDLVEEICSEDNDIIVVEDERKLNINLATYKELLTLPNVGKTTAEKIIEYRLAKKFDSKRNLN